MELSEDEVIRDIKWKQQGEEGRYAQEKQDKDSQGGTDWEGGKTGSLIVLVLSEGEGGVENTNPLKLQNSQGTSRGS